MPGLKRTTGITNKQLSQLLDIMEISEVQESVKKIKIKNAISIQNAIDLNLNSKN